eukprot:1161838-Pelagomonas_calceolata.AAC.6
MVGDDMHRYTHRYAFVARKLVLPHKFVSCNSHARVPSKTAYHLQEKVHTISHGKGKTITHTPQRDGSGGEQDLKRAVTMNLHGKSLASTAALEECPNLRSLDLSFNLIVDIEGCVSN